MIAMLWILSTRNSHDQTCSYIYNANTAPATSPAAESAKLFSWARPAAPVNVATAGFTGVPVQDATGATGTAAEEDGTGATV